MSATIEPRLKDKGPCQCNGSRTYNPDGSRVCELFGTLGTPDREGWRHVRGCKDTGCPVCMGRNNRRSGLRKQSKARKALGVGASKFGDANEERWVDALFANEVKSGAQCKTLVTWWRKVEAQVVANEATYGDRRRPVRATAMPADWGDEGLVVVKLSTWRDLVRPALEAAYGEAS